MPRSIYRSKEHADIIKQLTEKNPENGVVVFPTIKALQCFAAVLGFDQKRRVKLDRSNTENIEWHTFDNDNYTHYIYLIALAESANISVLKFDINSSESVQPNDNMMEVFEEYANGGFDIIRSWLNKSPADPYGNKAFLVAMEKAGYIKKVDDVFSEVEF